jgi:hypothetical protein
MEYVTSELIGALGNQLFNWAAGYSIANQKGWVHLIDDSKIQKFGCYLNEFEIYPNNYQRNVNLTDSLRESNSKVVRKIDYISQQYLQKDRKSKIFQEKYFHFDPSVLKIGPNKILRGYFQSWKYFEPHLVDVQKKLLSSQKLDNTSEQILQSIGSQNWLGIHVRRGDYVEFAHQHGLTSKKYYDRAIKVIQSEVTPDCIVVFSDDLLLSKEVVPGADFYISPAECSNPAQNMMVMSRAKSFVGSNSTYSWWAAFQMDVGSRIIFPRPWFAHRKLLTDDLLMPDWITLGI